MWEEQLFQVALLMEWGRWCGIAHCSWEQSCWICCGGVTGLKRHNSGWHRVSSLFWKWLTWVFRRPEGKGCLNQGVWTRGHVTWAGRKIFLLCGRSSRCCTKNWLKMERLPKWISAARFQCCVCADAHEKKAGERKRVGKWHETWWGNKWAFSQHPAPSVFLPPSPAGSDVKHAHTGKATRSRWWLLLICEFALSHLCNPFLLHPAAVPQALKIPWCGYLV